MSTGSPGRPVDRMNSVVYESAIARLADAEVNKRVLEVPRFHGQVLFVV